MQTLHTHTIPDQGNILPKDWQKSVEYYTSNDLITAYLKGKEEGKKDEFDKSFQEFSVNVKLATSIAEELFALGKDQDIVLNEIHLKANTLYSFEVLYLVDKKLFLSDNFRAIYVLSRQLRNKYKTDKFNLSFSFTPQSEEVSVDCLGADGFFMRYEKGKEA